MVSFLSHASKTSSVETSLHSLFQDTLEAHKLALYSKLVDFLRDHASVYFSYMFTTVYS